MEPATLFCSHITACCDLNSLNQLSSLARKLVNHFKHSALATAALKKARTNECSNPSSLTRCSYSLELYISDVSMTT